jgi:hypothetical protein
MHLLSRVLSLVCVIPQCDDEITAPQKNKVEDEKDALLQEKDAHNDVEDPPPPTYEVSIKLPDFYRSLDDARHSSLSVMVSHAEKGEFSQYFASVISKRAILPKVPFPRDCILFEPDTAAQDVFYPDDKYSIRIYLNYSKDDKYRFCCNACNPATQTITKTNLYTYIDPASAVRVFFKRVSKDEPSQGTTFHAVSIDRNVVRQFIGE